MKPGHGMGFASWLTLIFVVSKVTNLVSWSWWLVFSPLIITTGLAVIITLLALLVLAVAAAKGKL